MTGQPEVRLEYSTHALERMQQMHVRKDECLSTRLYPVETYFSKKHRSTTYQGRRIAIATRPTEERGLEVVTTVLWVDEAVYTLTDPTRKKWEPGRRRY